jgi:uncharacterized membrane protein
MKKLLFVLMALAAIGVSGYALVMFTMTPPLFESKGDLITDPIWKFFFYLHVGGGLIALAIGWLQFWKRLRQRNIKLHRNLGKLYILVILLGAISAGYSAIFATGGFGNQLGFFLLAVVWFFTTLQAYLAIRKGNVVAHKHWMTYSYAATFAAVTLRIFLPLWMGMGISFEEAYNAIAWFCWIPNLAIAQWIINVKWVE